MATAAKANTFADLKKNRTASLETLTKKIEELSTKASYGDDRFWKPQVDKSGNGFAVFRFLPQPKGEDYPWVIQYEHAFQGPGGWLIDLCPTSIGEQCSICTSNGKLWNSGIDDNKDQARKQKRKLSYISNIYMINDPVNPDNNGKVFLFKYGKKIFEKINDVMNPSFEDETAYSPFDLWEGANFKMKIRNVEGYRNYDKSEFDVASPLSTKDEELQKIYDKEYSLQEFLDPKKYKSSDELEAKLRKVLCLDEPERQLRNAVASVTSTPTRASIDDAIKGKPVYAADDEPDDDYFKRLVSDED